LEYETDWSGGDELTLILQDTLASDRTYVITIGSGATDMQKNRMADSYQFAFSTGNKLNKGEIYGRVFDISEKYISITFNFTNPVESGRGSVPVITGGILSAGPPSGRPREAQFKLINR
jgi:hypothetical protein